MEKFVLKTILTISVLTSLAACGPKVQSDSLSDMDVIQGNVDVDKESGRAEGTGITKFKKALTARDAALLMDLEGSLKHIGSQIAVISHAQASDLSDGVRVTFTRLGTDHVQCAVQVGLGLITMIQSSRMVAVPYENLRMTLEIRNSWPRSQVIAWPEESPRSGTLAIFDTEYNAHIDAPLNTVAPGLDMGLKLNDAKVTRAQLK